MFNYDYFCSPLGRIVIACDDDAILGVWFENQRYYPLKLNLKDGRKVSTPMIEKVKCWFTEYFNGKNPSISELNLAPIGSEFSSKVWEILRQIPYGKTITYGQIAKKN